MLQLTRAAWIQMVAHAYDGLPDEACGLLAGPPGTHQSTVFYPCRNAAQSSRVYTVDTGDHLRADRDAESRGLEINGVVHSHTHTDAYPSPTDIQQAPDPAWHYLIVSLRDEAPVTRSYRIVRRVCTEEVVAVVDPVESRQEQSTFPSERAWPSTNQPSTSSATRRWWTSRR